MQLTLYRTLCIHTLLLMGLGAFFVEHRRAHAAHAPSRHVRMPTLDELLQIECLGMESKRYEFWVGRMPQYSVNEDANLRKLLDLLLLYVPPEHPEAVSCRTQLAHYLEQAGRFAKAAEQYQILLKVYQRVMGPDEPETTSLQKDVARVMQILTRSKAEEREWRWEYGKQVATLGKEDLQVLHAQSRIADQLVVQSKYPEAEIELRSVVKALVQKQGERNAEMLVRNMGKLAMCLASQGKRNEALEFVREIEWLQADTPEMEPWLSEVSYELQDLRNTINAGRIKRRAK
ncbi:tetratricopeptide repeat protein [Prosthecobacter sp.]|uniref:tetratricopeptide repeat protein n=1 Tax=Prosthecobacter sp. TaxID=1965333 RepID=UPI0037847A82